MSEQGQLFDPSTVNSYQFAPVTHVADAAKRYTEGWTEPDNQIQANSERGRAQYHAYKDAQAAPEEAPGIRDSYASMREHVGKQYEYMTKPEDQGGMGFTHEVTHEDPYPTPSDMAKDVAGKRIKTFATESTGGHEYFTNEENDRFRAVHDVFGHAGIGRGFSRHGEEAAFQAHRQMFPPEAHAALTSETRGQNSYLNYGGGDFPEQGPGSKLVGLPQWASEDGPVPVKKSRAQRRGGAEQLRLF